MVIDVDAFVFVFSALTVVHFYAPWAPHCVQMNDVMDVLAKDHLHVKFFKVSEEL